jgi:hypothetical protein
MNQRNEPCPSPPRRRLHLLLEFPDPRLESVVIQWETFLPTVLIQLKQVEGELGSPTRAKKTRLPALDSPLLDFVDPSTGMIFGREAFRADLLMSGEAFSLFQPEPDLVLPIAALDECRTEALRALGISDELGFSLSPEA